MSNRLKYEKSPYLLQHADNPVDWYPWGSEAFERAEAEDKPIFLSIGYSTCHWCHVMARESFEDSGIAGILNRFFIPVKVDREERPDIDGVYMKACQAMTGGGGWPASLFLTPGRKPFFAGTYFPPDSRYGMTGFYDLLRIIADKWKHDKVSLLESSDKIADHLKPEIKAGKPYDNLPEEGAEQFSHVYDGKYGGFGDAPKFPTPHNLIFLLLFGSLNNNKKAADMALYTLTRMRAGGIFDHIGGGFSRYSTDRMYLVPHFEKMLYDNALLIMAYVSAFAATKNEVYLNTARKSAEYLFREMQSPEGAFYSAQDADSEGEEGLFYVFDYEEPLSVLGENEGKRFNQYFGITKGGNFEGKNIPNRLHSEVNLTDDFKDSLSKMYEYRKKRRALHLDDKILTSWNSLMIIALCFLYRATGERVYLDAASRADQYIKKNLSEKKRLFVSFRDGERSGIGFLDEYAFYSAALISLYRASNEQEYLERAESAARSAVEQFWDEEGGGFCLSGKENEKLIFDHKEVYDGALPSGNSVMAFVLVRLSQAGGRDSSKWREYADRQLSFLAGQADYPMGHCMYLLSILFDKNPPPKITVVCSADTKARDITAALPLYADIRIIEEETEEYPLINGKTTYYVCRGHACLPPANDLKAIFDYAV